MLRKIVFCTIFINFFVNKSNSQDELVDLFTGDFNYSTPLLYIPSIEGPGIPLVIDYKSGIAVHQKSSSVGLGWSVETGEIRRDVKGIPDDWTAVIKSTNVYDKSGSNWVLNSNESSIKEVYGPLYFKNFGTRTINKEMDVYTSSNSGLPFSFPDFDDYIVSAPGVSGIFQPLIMDIGTMVKKDDYSGTNTLKYDAPGINPGQNLERPINLRGEDYNIPPADLGQSNNCRVFSSYKPVQFRYLNEFGNITPLNETNNTYQTGPSLEEITINSNQKYYNAIGSRHIVSYTKQEYVNGTDGLMKYPGFNTSAQNETDILAFKITNESGYTFHFSLPVFVKEEKNINIEMDGFDITNAKRVRVTNLAKFVTSWKLTAITGPDFIDNGSIVNYIDPGDKGYWIKFTYNIWSDDFNSQTPYYDGNRHFGEDIDALQQYRENYPNAKSSVNSYWGEYQDQINICKDKLEIYVLDKIESSTHVAFFVKDVRLDEHSKKQSANEKPTPNLLLKRIILMNATDANLFNSSSVLNTPGSSLFKIPPSSSNIIHETKYQNNKVLIDEKTISSIEFNYDYSLCKNYAANINNNLPVSLNVPLTFVNSLDNFTFESYPSIPTVTPTNSGKLTLLSIIPYGVGATSNQIPSTVFQYSLINPDFNPLKRDFWGSYLKDWTNLRPAEFQSETSISDISAWHLSKIATPAGGIIEIEFESDKYEKIAGYDKQITRVFGGKFSYQNQSIPEQFLFDDRGLYDLLASNNTLGSISLGYPCRCTWSQQYYYAPTQSWGDFIESVSITLKKKIYGSKSEINFSLDGLKTKIIPSVGGLFGLQPFCGKGPQPISGQGPGLTISNENINKALATVNLLFAYGGGVRVKTLKFREVDASGLPLVYTREYQYNNGVASQEPGRYTPPFYSRRPTMRDLYDRHNFAPSVGYSKTVVKDKGVNDSYADKYSVYNFNNYDDWQYGSPGISVGVQDQTFSNIYTNWDSYFNCLNANNNNPEACLTDIPIDRRFEVYSLAQTGKIKGRDRSKRFVGRLANFQTYDINNRLIYSSEQEYKKIESTSSTFHQKTHGMIPVSYDKDFLFYNNAAFSNRVLLKGFGPFTSPNATGHSTLMNSSLYYQKVIENEVVEKIISAENDMRKFTSFLEFDPITGRPVKIQSKDPSTGEVIEKQIEFAYNNPLYAIFGPKARFNSGNKNLLTYISLEKTFKGGNLVDGVRRDFGNTSKVRTWNASTLAYVTIDQAIPWSIQKTFAFDGNLDPNSWKQENEYTLFNSKGSFLETKDFFSAATSRYSMVKFGYSNRFKITECSDSKYTESTYSGAEDYGEESNYFSGEVKISVSNASVNTNLSYVHTGKQSLQINPGGRGFEYKIPCFELDRDRSYIGRVWVYKAGNTGSKIYYEIKHNSTNIVAASGSVNFSSGDNFNNQGYVNNSQNWALLTLNIAIPNSGDVYNNFSNYSLIVRCENSGTSTTYFDDFRVHPINSKMVNYVYNTFLGLPEYIINPDGFYVKIVYSSLGKPYRQYIETPDGERQILESNQNFYRFSNNTPF